MANNQHSMKGRRRWLGGIAAVTALAATAWIYRRTMKSGLTVGVAIPAASHGFSAGIVYWANRAAIEFASNTPPVRVVVRAAKDAAEQVAQLAELERQHGIDALVILPFESQALTAPVAAMKDRGIYVTVVDRGLTDSAAQDSYIAGDNHAFGRIAAEYMAQALRGKGRIVALRGIKSTIDDIRMNAFKAVMSAHPGIELLDAQHANWNAAEAKTVMTAMLQRFGQIDAVWAADDDMALGVLDALKEASRSDVKLVFGGAGSKQMVHTLIDGSNPLISANVSYSPRFIYDAVRLTIEARAKGESLPPAVSIPSVLITRKNAREFYYPDSPF